MTAITTNQISKFNTGPLLLYTFSLAAFLPLTLIGSLTAAFK